MTKTTTTSFTQILSDTSQAGLYQTSEKFKKFVTQTGVKLTNILVYNFLTQSYNKFAPELS